MWDAFLAGLQSLHIFFAHRVTTVSHSDRPDKTSTAVKLRAIAARLVMNVPARLGLSSSLVAMLFIIFTVFAVVGVVTKCHKKHHANRLGVSPKLLVAHHRVSKTVAVTLFDGFHPVKRTPSGHS